MKILICTNYLPPHIGGIERHTVGLANALSQNEKNKVTIVTNSMAHYDSNEFLSGSVDILSFPSFEIAKRLPVPNLFCREFYRNILQNDWKYDLVILQSHLFILNWIVAILSHNSPKRIWMNHGSWHIKINSPWLRPIVLVYEKIGMLLMRKFCNVYTAQGESAAAWASRKTRISFEVIFNGIDIDKIRLQLTKKHREKNSILLVSRLVPGKGIEQTLEAFSELKRLSNASRSILKWTLTIVGDGELETVVRNREDEGIFFLGPTEHANVLRLMQSYEFLIQTFEEPGDITTVMLEAIASGMIVVTTPIASDSTILNIPNLHQCDFGSIPSLIIGLEYKRDVTNASIALSYLERNFDWKKIAYKFASFVDN